jgi:hypothetical protein
VDANAAHFGVAVEIFIRREFALNMDTVATLRNAEDYPGVLPNLGTVMGRS